MAQRARKARVEGAKAIRPAAKPEVPEEPLADENGPEPEDLTEPRLPNPVPGDDGEALDRIHAYFVENHPEEYDNIRLCPLQSGIPAMADILRGRG